MTCYVASTLLIRDCENQDRGYAKEICGRPWSSALFDGAWALTCLVIGLLTLYNPALQWRVTASWALIGIGSIFAFSSICMILAGVIDRCYKGI